MLELNKSDFSDREEWYYKYSYVLISELAMFKDVLPIIKENPLLKA